MEFQRGAGCPAGDTCNRNIRHRRPRRLGRRRRRGGARAVRLHLLPERRPGRVVDLAGVRPDQVPDQGGRDRRLRPAGSRAAELVADPLRRVDVVGGGLLDLAQRGRRLARPRPRAPGMAVFAHEFSHILGIARQLQQPVRRAAAPRLQRHLGDAQPRQLQRSRRPAQPLDDPADRRRLDGRAAHAAQQDRPRDGRRGERAAAVARGAGRVGPGGRARARARGQARRGRALRRQRRLRRPATRARPATRTPTRSATAAATTTTRSRSSTAWAPTRSRPTPACCWPRPRTATRAPFELGDRRQPAGHRA